MTSSPAARVTAAALARDASGDLVASALRALARWQAVAGKICAHCRRERALSDFGVDASRRDGLNPTCRECRTALRRGRVCYSTGPLHR